MRPKDIGTRAETAIVKYLQPNGFPYAERRALSGNKDKGDILACPGLIFESKADKDATTGQPGPALLHRWMTEAERERANADADLCPVIVKRKGTADPGKWFAYIEVRDMMRLLGGDTYPDGVGTDPVCMAFATLVPLLRNFGYGTPLPTGGGATAIDTLNAMLDGR